MPVFCARVIGAKPVQPLIASVTLGTSAQAELIAEAVQNTAPRAAAAKAAIHRLAIVRSSCRSIHPPHSLSGAVATACSQVFHSIPRLPTRIWARPVAQTARRERTERIFHNRTLTIFRLSYRAIRMVYRI